MHDGEQALYVRLYLWSGSDVPGSEEIAEQFLDDLAGFLIAKGFGNADQDVLRSIMVAGSAQLPDDTEQFVPALASDPETSMFMLPGATSDDD